MLCSRLTKPLIVTMSMLRLTSCCMVLLPMLTSSVSSLSPWPRCCCLAMSPHTEARCHSQESLHPPPSNPPLLWTLSYVCSLKCFITSHNTTVRLYRTQSVRWNVQLSAQNWSGTQDSNLVPLTRGHLHLWADVFVSATSRGCGNNLNKPISSPCRVSLYGRMRIEDAQRSKYGHFMTIEFSSLSSSI